MRDGTEIFVGSKWAAYLDRGAHGIGEHQERHQYLSDIFGQYFMSSAMICEAVEE